MQQANELSDVADSATSQKHLIRDQIRSALASGAVLSTKELTEVCPAALDASSIAKEIYCLRKADEIEPIDDPLVPVRRWRLRSAVQPDAQPKGKPGRPQKTAPVAPRPAAKAAKPVLVVSSAVKPPTPEPPATIPDPDRRREPETTGTPEPPPQTVSDPITPEVFAAVHRRAHALSLAHYDRLCTDLLEAVRAASDNLKAGTDLVRYVEQMEGPGSDLVIIRREDLWAVTSIVAVMQTAHEHAMERVHLLEEATGKEWYGRPVQAQV